MPVKLVATVITIAIGGSAGKEGPCAQIGAGTASFFARILNFDEVDRRKLVICGISAGFATVFGTPIAGAIFGVEVLFIGDILYDVLLPSFISAITAYEISSFFGVPYLYAPTFTIPGISELLLIKVVISGIVFGIMSVVLITGLNSGRNLFDKFRLWPPFRAIIGGSFLVILTLCFGKRYLGLGVQTISSALNGDHIAWYTPLLKIVFTSITLNFGGSGGIVTPIFFIGSTTGSVLGDILNIDSSVL